NKTNGHSCSKNHQSVVMLCKRSVQKLCTTYHLVGSTKPKGCHDPAYFCYTFIQSKIIQVFKITFDTNCLF
ncbi:MAG: hypothetical protein ACN6PD_12215, partial [Sphingobacterium sp.]